MRERPTQLNPPPTATAAAPPIRERTMPGRAQRAWVFIRNFFKHPLMVGSFLQSSPRLVERLCGEIEWQAAKTVVEYGPGVGTITTALLDRLPRDGRLVALELNTEFADLLDDAIDDARLAIERGPASMVGDALRRVHRTHADAILSGIPFSVMSEKDRDETLRATHDALRPGGRFVVYQYSRKVLPHLRRQFGDVRTGVEWRNSMPMQVFVCTRGE